MNRYNVLSNNELELCGRVVQASGGDVSAVFLIGDVSCSPIEQAFLASALSDAAATAIYNDWLSRSLGRV